MKERVVVFDGEDKFIAKKDRIYDKSTGKSYGGKNPEGDRFKQYMLEKQKGCVVPELGDPDFCKKAEQFIKTRGEGKATPEQVWKVHSLFQDNCVEKPKEKSAAGDIQTPPIIPNLPTSTTPTFPDWESLDCDSIEREIAALQQTLLTSRFSGEMVDLYNAAISRGTAVKAQKCGIAPPVLGDTPLPPASPTPRTPSPISVNPLGVSLSASTLGTQPNSASQTKSDSGDKKKSSNLLIWILLGGAVIYLLTSNKK